MTEEIPTTVMQAREHVKALFDAKDMATYGKPYYFDHHLTVVNDIASVLAAKYGGDREVISMGAFLHDLGMAHTDIVSEHDRMSIEAAQKLLSRFDMSPQKIDAILGCIRTHGCKKDMPVTLEEKIVATSDGLSHLLTPWYFIKNRYSDKTPAEFFKWGLNKSKKDYDKIQFEDERKKAKEYLDFWNRIFTGNVSSNLL